MSVCVPALLHMDSHVRLCVHVRVCVRVYYMMSCEQILVTVIPLAAVSREKSNGALWELDPDMGG